jgi:DNA-binding XRE family transcriptional regulator
MKLHKWSDTLAKSKLSLERRARIQAEVEQQLLEMNLQELRKAAGVTQADVAAKTGMAQADVSRTESRPSPSRARRSSLTCQSIISSAARD